MASLIVLYDWPESLNQRAWIELGLNFFNLLGSKPNWANWVRRGERAGKIRQGKTRPENLTKALERGSFTGAAITMLLAPFDDFCKYSHSCGFSERPDERRRNAYFCYESDEIDVDLTIGLLQAFASIAKPAYGIGYRLPYRRGPTYHVRDISYGAIGDFPDQTEMLSQVVWRNERHGNGSWSPPFRHLEGMLRDVFEFNVLSNVHLQSKIHGISLSNWIVSNRIHGQLDDIGDGLWTWIVPKAELSSVQIELQNAGLLITKPRQQA